MKCSIFFKQTIEDVYKGELDAHYSSLEEAEKDAERIVSVLNEISDYEVSYEIDVTDDPWDILVPTGRTRAITRNSYRYFYTVEHHGDTFDDLATYTVPDLCIKIEAPYGAGLSILREAVRAHLEYLVSVERVSFPSSKEVECRSEKYHERVKQDMMTVILNPVIEREKQKLGL
ncbi:hypothetical protein M3202_17620 [Alkalihalobacillus oceani]|uniref:Uncharacterized protein n=1 Tax=Halalkalibacter oceani TaxID=1653776 RepID=A0A9X2DSH4_9BACI|nr:hypothetical protein [Halalkalibacter oceani]MCM3715876.1 hypothetical protein [Halalkalibacter oceani]